MARAFAFAVVASLFLCSSLRAQQPASTYEILAAGGTNGPGARPAAGLVRGPDGNYYGTTSEGGALGGGTVFKLTPEGTLSALVSFSYEEGSPATTLIVGSDGHLYGTTAGAFPGTPGSTGTVFRVTLAGELTVLARFVNGSPPLINPRKLVEASDGHLYGTTTYGGAQNLGSVFRLTKAGVLTTLISFTGDSNGAYPAAGLTADEDGYLYGVTAATAFRMSLDGVLTTFATFPFSGPPGTGLAAELTKSPDGDFYGVSSSGGENRSGTVFKLTKAGAVTVLASLPSNSEANPSPVILGSDGNLYGTTPQRYYRVSPAGGLTVLVSFATTSGGRDARGSLLNIGNGEFLGTTYSGARTDLNHFGLVHRLTEQGTAAAVVAFPKPLGRNFNSELIEVPGGELYGTFDDDRSVSFSRFRGIPGPFKLTTQRAAIPLRSLPTFSDADRSSRMVRAGDGSLYGMISEGGQLSEPPPNPNMGATGFIYRLTPSGNVSTLYQFAGFGDGSFNEPGDAPAGGLVIGPDGQLYGTASLGGPQGGGTFFKVDLQGNFTRLASFGYNGSAGSGPTGVIFRDGMFYGATRSGGQNGTGVFFTATPEGEITPLVSFPANTYLAFNSRLIVGSDGNFYGVFFNGGPSNAGSVFRVTKSGVLTTFAAMDASTGSNPVGIMQASDGNFYGVTRPQNGPGSIFRVDSSGAVTTLTTFSPEKGSAPNGQLTEATDGYLYGTTAGGGPSQGGVIFRLAIGPKPQLLNIATRLRVQTGDNVMIGGFIVTGNAPKKVMIRGIGPSLAGVQGTLANPTLELRNGAGEVIQVNDNWQDSQRGEIEATTIPPRHDLESAIVRTLAPGAYTAILAGNDRATGVAVVEAYDLDPAADAKLANISTRGFVETGDDVMIGGVIVASASSVLVRAIGPSLQQAGVGEALTDPVLELRDRDGALLASNDNWKDDADQAAQIQATGVPPQNDLESAVIARLPTGGTTAIVRGNGNQVGVAVVEVYHLAN